MQALGEWLTSIGLGVPGWQWDLCSIIAFCSPILFAFGLTTYSIISDLIENAQNRKWLRDRKRSRKTLEQQDLPRTYESKWYNPQQPLFGRVARPGPQLLPEKTGHTNALVTGRRRIKMLQGLCEPLEAQTITCGHNVGSAGAHDELPPDEAHNRKRKARGDIEQDAMRSNGVPCKVFIDG